MTNETTNVRKVLLLKATYKKLPAVESYLGSRGYKVQVVTRLHDAIQFIMDERPDFALLPVELVPSRCAWLFAILARLTGIVLYAERISAKTLSINREFKDTYLLEPPLTPMGIEQMLRRAERDQSKHMQEASQLSKIHIAIMSALSDLALKAVCEPSGGSSGAGAETIDRATRVTCFRVQTKNLAGYFVLAYGQNRFLDSSWVARLQNELKGYITTFDEHPQIEPGEDLVIEEVQFNQWTKQQAEFIRSAAHQESDLVLAFFKDTSQLEIRASSEKDHVELNIEHLRTDYPVDFDVYIYLPQNARFVLYTPSGGTMYANQKEKLISEGISSVHIHKRSLDEVRRYRARKFIDESAAPFSGERFS